MSTTPPRLEYARSLYSDVVYWYKSADTKAQILLALIGAFVAFLTSSILVDVSKLQNITKCMDDHIWDLLLAMATAVTLSVIAALACLWSRTRLKPKTRKDLKAIKADEEYPVSGRIIGYFGTLYRIPEERFEKELSSLGYEEEMKIRSAQIWYLSSHVHWKHFFVNIGFWLGAVSLVLYLIAAAFYLTNVSEGACVFHG